MPDALTVRATRPDAALSDVVESYWLLHNASDEPRRVVILPDGRIDLFLSRSAEAAFHMTLLGLETGPSEAVIAPQALSFAVSFRPLAAEYVWHRSLAPLLDSGEVLPADHWGFGETDLTDFDAFCRKATEKIKALMAEVPDPRKKAVFDLMYASSGAVSVHELAAKCYWSSRQINRYFTQQYGLSPKQYCNILRFRASFQQLKDGKLFPEESFADQSHFIREVKKLAGATPKELSRNKDDRYVQLSALPSKRL